MLAPDELNGRIDALRSEARRLVADGTELRAVVAKDSNLTPQGKADTLKRYFDTASNKMDQFKEEELRILRTTLDEKKTALFAMLGSTASDLIAMRDAEERADRISDHSDAASALERATRTGDRSLAYAILRRALDAGWRDVVAKAFEAFPEAADTVGDIQDLDERVNGYKSRFSRDTTYSIAQ
jgi:hypothetical protein